MLPEREARVMRNHWIEIAWGIFAALNLMAMLLFGDWETVPFHFLWVSVTLLYGFRVWSVRSTVWTLAVVMATTGTFILIDVARELQPIDEVTEVPLMAAMFIAMVWHARRRLAAMEALQRVSEDNLALLERERRFIQDASHELRTPITVALGHTELILRNSSHELVAQDAAVVADELHRLRRLAERLLVLAAAEHPGFLVKTTIDLEPLLVETLRRWSPTPRRWGLGDVDETTVEADRDRLQLALDALIENAVKHTSPEDSIELGLSRRENAAVLTVADSGGGIPPETLDRIFDRFARADPARDRDRGGMGLGLSVVRAIAEAHGGSVRVRSTPAMGTTFEMLLPFAPVAIELDHHVDVVTSAPAETVAGQLPVG
jgi:signal transduction histidine kinase